MSIHRAKEYGDRLGLKSSGKSVSNPKNTRREAIKDHGKAVTPSEKFTKRKPTTTPSSSRSGRPSMKISPDKRKSEINEEESRRYKNGKSTSKTIYTNEVQKDFKTDLIQSGNLTEKKDFQRREKERRKEVEAPLDDEVQAQMNEEKIKMEGSKIKRDRTRTRTLSPTEIKQLLLPPHKSGSGDHLEREEATSAAATESLEVEKDEYESDFEDYESDFEEVESESSVEDFSERHSSNLENEYSAPQIADTTKETTKKVSSDFENDRWKSDFQTGHSKDIKHYKIQKENTEITEKKKSIADYILKPEENDTLGEGHLIDFSMAFKKQKSRKEADDARKRGKELLNMITLDAITYNILEIPPTPYEFFIRTFGKSNTKQVSVQTNDDVLEEEIQTVEVETCDKWTQFPVDFLGRKRNDGQTCYILTKEERLGVGGENLMNPTNDNCTITFQPKTSQFHTFLSWASQVILEALERKSSQFLNLEKMPHQDKDMAFADGFIRLKTEDVSPFADKSVTDLRLLGKTSRKLLAIHSNKNKHFQRCILSVWSFQELSKPLKILVSSNRVTSCTFGPNQGNFVIAGLSDGTLCLWDLRESSIYHSKESNNSNWILQQPTYTTAGDLHENEHSTSIVSVQLLTGLGNFGINEDFSPIQLCSLDESGIIVVWSVIQLDKPSRTEPSNDLGLAYWGKLKLVKSSFFTIFDNLKNETPSLYVTCKDLLINETEDDGFYVASSSGRVHHLSTYGSLMKPKFFMPSKRDFIVEATCLELCPFDGNYFLVGCGDGSIRLHSRHQENPLNILHSNVVEGERQTSIVTICWLNTRPCVIFSLDSKSRIQVWDLAISDMYPEMTLAFANKKILSMKLLTDSDARRIPFIVAGMEDGSVEIHRVKREYGRRTISEIAFEKKMFLRYVSIL